MAAYNYEGVLIEGTEGRVVKLESKSTYLGDGDTSFYWQATVATDEGFVSISVGKSGWRHEWADACGSEIDAPQSVVDFYPVWLEELREKSHKKTYNEPHDWIQGSSYEFKKGQLGFVTKGSGRRKNAGKWGYIVWIGENRFGQSCGLKHPDTGDVAWVSTDQVAIIPDYDDFEPISTAQAAD